jgi:hypothetical protein
MAVLVIPRHGASGSLARLEDAPADHLINVEAQARLNCNSCGASVVVGFGHVLSFIRNQMVRYLCRSAGDGCDLTLLLEPATVLISATDQSPVAVVDGVVGGTNQGDDGCTVDRASRGYTGSPPVGLPIPG